VKTADGVTLDQALAAIKGHGATFKKSITDLNLNVVTVPFAGANGIANALAHDPLISRVEADTLRKFSGAPAPAAPVQTSTGLQWYLSKIGWDTVTASPTQLTSVAVLDTGVDATHPDLVGNLAAGASMIDDSNGTTDGNGHGTWVSGIV